MTLKEAAESLGTSPDNLRGAIARGTFKATKLGRDWIVSAAEVERYRRENRRAIHSPAEASDARISPRPRTTPPQAG
jgi:excisionase family DNA binding protein